MDTPDHQFDITFTLTRDDWIRFNTAFISGSPVYEEAARAQARTHRRSMLLYTPVIVVGATLFIGRGASTRGMYLEGAAAGLILAGLILWGLGSPRHHLGSMRRQALRDLAAADFSEHTGRIRLALDELGIDHTSPGARLRLPWRSIVGIETRAGYFMINAQSTAMIVPLAALGECKDRFIDSARELWKAGQLPGSERLARYLADRDLPCPRCSYNLRNLKAETCPECGEALTIERVHEVAAKRGRARSP